MDRLKSTELKSYQDHWTTDVTKVEDSRSYCFTSKWCFSPEVKEG